MLQNWKKNICARVSFLLKFLINFIEKKRLWHRYFPVNFATFLRIHILKNIRFEGEFGISLRYFHILSYSVSYIYFTSFFSSSNLLVGLEAFCWLFILLWFWIPASLLFHEFWGKTKNLKASKNFYYLHTFFSQRNRSIS